MKSTCPTWVPLSNFGGPIGGWVRAGQKPVDNTGLSENEVDRLLLQDPADVRPTKHSCLGPSGSKGYVHQSAASKDGQVTSSRQSVYEFLQGTLEGAQRPGSDATDRSTQCSATGASLTVGSDKFGTGLFRLH